MTLALTTSGHANHVGRVGAAAVALGLGVAIAQSPGIASADPASSGSSTGSSSSKGSSSTVSTPSKSTIPGATGATSTASPPASSVTTKPPTARHTVLAVPSTTSLSTASPVTSAPHRAPIDSTRTSPVPSPVITSQGSAGWTAAHYPASIAPSAAVATASRSQTAQVSTQLTPTMQSAAPASSVVAQIVPAAMNAAITPIRIVTGLVSGLLSWVGLDPQATNGPVPTQAPTTWTLLGWVRREIGALFSGTPTTNSAQTSQALAGPTSPLGTPNQIAAEAVATQAVNTPLVQLAESVLGFAWRNDAQQQFAMVGGPDQTNLAQLNDAVSEYATQAAIEVQLLDPNNPQVLQGVMPPHTWYGQTVNGSRILYDNPDTIYRFIPVNTASTYVITGQFTGATPADTNFSVLTGLNGTTAANLNGADLRVNPDGTFTITVGSAPPAPGQTNYLQLPSGATLIAARNTLSNWNTQEPMSLSVQRVSGPPDSLFSEIGGFDIPLIGTLVSGNPLLTSLVSLIPPVLPEQLVVDAETPVVMALGLQMEPQYMAVATTNPATGQLNPPNVLSQPAHNAAFLATQLQSGGYFELTNNQALVITINPGNAGYFDVPVTNDWTITNNYWDEQTSLNNAQAVANPDGTYTLVVSPTDPGVSNWVSTGGLNQGTLSIRFQDFNANSTTTPTVSSQLVSLDQLSQVLPATTQYVTPQQRQAQIAARQSGYNNRFAPYPQP